MGKCLFFDVPKFVGTLDDDVYCLTSRGSYPLDSDYSDRGKGSFWSCLEDEVFGDLFSSEVMHSGYPYQDFCLGGHLFLTIPKNRHEKFVAFCQKHKQDYIVVYLISRF